MRIDERIDKALDEHGNKWGEIAYVELARHVFPPDQYPRAWGSPTRGGPPGCYMSLSSAIRRYKFVDFTNRHGRRMIGRRRGHAQ